MAMLPAPSPLHATRPVVVLEHEPIQGLMEEKMSMPFIVDSAALFGDLKIGERVAFELVDTPGALLVVRLDRLRR
jgi:Cu/Ag efflux protein CusF